MSILATRRLENITMHLSDTKVSSTCLFLSSTRVEILIKKAVVGQLENHTGVWAFGNLIKQAVVNTSLIGMRFKFIHSNKMLKVKFDKMDLCSKHSSPQIYGLTSIVAF